MDRIRFGRQVRALRHRKRWRQQDLAVAAGVSRGMICRIEAGDADGLPVRSLDAVAAALGARVECRLSWNGEALDRLLDADHASAVEHVARMLRLDGWAVATEVTFNIFGERGSIDLLAFHDATGTLLVVEVKSVVPDVQATLASIDRKTRLAAEIGRERGWRATRVWRVLVIRDSRTSRRRIDQHAVTFDAAMPARTREVRRAMRDPASTLGTFGGIWFLPDVAQVSTRHRVPRQRA